jgi:hypothetical protein
MTAANATAAIKLALSDADLKADLSPFDGFGLPGYQPVHVTLEQVAGLIRWQAITFNGELEQNALREVLAAGKRHFLIVP